MRTPEARARHTPMILSVTFFFAASADAAVVAASDTAVAKALKVAVTVSVVDMLLRVEDVVDRLARLVSRGEKGNHGFRRQIQCIRRVSLR